jgi:hypothetical protein
MFYVPVGQTDTETDSLVGGMEMTYNFSSVMSDC